MRVLKTFKEEQSHKRTALTQTTLTHVPFQLLPRVTYPASRQETSLVWQSQFAEKMLRKPFFSVVIFVDAADKERCRKTIEALTAQSYQNFELILIVSGKEEKASGFYPHFAKNRLNGVLLVEEESPVAISLAQVLPYISGEYLIVGDVNTIFHPQAFFIIAKEITKKSPSFVYFNEVLLNPGDSSIADAFLRRAPLSDLAPVSTNPVGEYFAVSKELANAMIHETPSVALPYYLCGWYFSLKVLTESLPYSFIRLALLLRNHGKTFVKDFLPPHQDTMSGLINRYLRQVGVPVERLESITTESEYSMRCRLKRANGSIQVVIPFHNKAELTCTALKSLMSQICFSDLEVVLINNNSEHYELVAIENFIEAQGIGRSVTILSDSDYFNYARLNNLGTELSKSEYILFMNNDVELRDSYSLDEMRSWCSVDGVAVVGAKLFYEDGDLQHGGINFSSIRPTNITEAEQYTHIVRETDAVTFALAMVKRSYFSNVNGLDEFLCPNAFGDALFCKKIREQGQKIIYTPFAQAIHRESASRAKSVEELELLEMSDEGLMISDLFGDFLARRQPAKLDIRSISEPPIMILSRKLNDSQKLSRTSNRLATVLLRFLRR